MGKPKNALYKYATTKSGVTTIRKTVWKLLHGSSKIIAQKKSEVGGERRKLCIASSGKYSQAAHGQWQTWYWPNIAPDNGKRL